MLSTNRSRAWWAATTARARLTALGAGVLTLGLGITSVIVWNSPGNPVSDAVTAASNRSTAMDEMRQERVTLLKKIDTLEDRLADRKGDLSTVKAQLASVQQELWSAEGKLDAAAVAKAKSKNKAPTTKPNKPGATPVSAPAKSAIVNPASPYFGLYTEQAPFSFSGYDATAAKIGSAPNLVGYFGGWDQNYRGDVVTSSWKRGKLPVLTWESRPITAPNGQKEEPEYSLPLIIGDPAAGVAGRYDDYLRQYARDIVATGLPLGIRLNHEMNGDWYPWSETDRDGNPINGNRVGDYAKTWQHVHDIFEQEGANGLVVWIWAPNIINNLPATHKTSEYLDGLYPGDQYVDVVGLSGYLRPPYKPENNFSFEYTFRSSLKELRRLTSKPILLAEVGASETDGHKEQWITSFFTALARPENQDIIGFSWFNLAVTSYTEGELSTNDWRIESRPEGLAAFKEGLAMPGSRFVLVPN